MAADEAHKEQDFCSLKPLLRCPLKSTVFGERERASLYISMVGRLGVGLSSLYL